MALLRLTYDQYRALKPWQEDDPERRDFNGIVAAFGGPAAWGPTLKSAAQMQAAGVDFHAVLWPAGKLASTRSDILRCLRLFAAHVLQYFAARYPTGDLRNAITQIRLFARGQIGQPYGFSGGPTGPSGGPTGAVWWGLSAMGDALTASTGALEARYRAKQEEPNADAIDATNAWVAERKWQYDRLVAWLSSSEPADWPV